MLVPLFLVFALNLPFKGVMRRVAPWAAGFLFAAQGVMVATRPEWFWTAGKAFERFFAFRLHIDAFSMVVFGATALVTFVSLLVGIETIKEERQRFKFVNLLLMSLTGMNAMVMAADIFSLYVFIEVIAVSAFILIVLNNDMPAFEGAFKYMILSVVASALMLTGIALMFMAAGDTSFGAVSAMLKTSSASVFMKLSVVLFLCGLFIKSGIVPFHGWLPDAYSAAPSAVSVLLAGIVTKASGVYVLMRLVISVVGFSPAVKTVLMAVGMISIIIGALAATGQKDFKRMLSYSSISQVGYMILALGCGTPLAIAGAMFHFFNHAVFKSLLFVNAASVNERVGSADMDAMGGLASRMPVTGATSVIAVLSTAGVPPLSGFWSKFMIVAALWMAGERVYAAAALLASIFTLSYLISMQRRVFFGKIKEGLEGIKEAGAGIVTAQVLLAAVTIGVGVSFPFMINVFMATADKILK